MRVVHCTCFCHFLAVCSPESMQVSAYQMDATSCLCSIFIEEIFQEGSKNWNWFHWGNIRPPKCPLHFIDGILLCPAKRWTEYCINLYQFLLLSTCKVSVFFAFFEPCFDQHFKNWQSHVRVLKLQKMLPKHGPLKNHTRVAFIKNETPCKQAKSIL